MNLRLAHSIETGLDHHLQWPWYSQTLESFILGDDRLAFTIPVADLNARTPLATGRPRTPSLGEHACNVPIPDHLYEELARTPLRGLSFLSTADYDAFAQFRPGDAGDILRDLVFGPDHGTPVRHSASRTILALRAGSIEIMRQVSGKFELVEKTRTRGKSALVFAASATEGMLAYGDNYGDFHLQAFTAEGFGRARKVGSYQRNAGGLDFISGGDVLVVAGSGYLAALDISSSRPSEICRVEVAARELHCHPDGAVCVNQGMHGIVALRFDGRGFSERAEIKLPFPANRMTVSPSLQHIAVTAKGASQVALVEVQV